MTVLSSLTIYSNPKCLICENDGNGVHFGVQTCRACAMFFRRSLHQQTEFQCKNHSKFCKIENADSRLMCKFCRLKKCQTVGMSNEKKDSSKCQDVVMSDPQRVIYEVLHPVTQKPVKWIDIGPIIRRSREILEEFHPPSTFKFQSLNALQKMTFSLAKFRNAQKMKTKILDFMTFDDYFMHWEEWMTRAAEWLMHSVHFRLLPNHEKLQFFKIVWAVWRRFERNSMSAKVFGKKCLDEKLLLISDDTVTVFDKLTIDHSEIQGPRLHEWRAILRHNLLQYFELVVRPCLEWNFTEMEINFALSQIAWNYASRKLLGQTLQAADSFLAEISENLHEYYQTELKIKNYAPRLAVIMDMVNGVLKNQLEHEKTMEMAFLFDMLSIVVSEPAFFIV